MSFPENVGCCEKNSKMGSVSFEDNDYTNMNREIQVDAKYDKISA